MYVVEVIGIPEYEQTIRLKQNVEQALVALGLDLPIQEISDLELMMQSNIRAIPALRVNGKILVQEQVPEVMDLESVLRQSLFQ